MKSEAAIRRDNEKNRNVPIVGSIFKQHVRDYLRSNIPAAGNFLINGTGENRESVLFQRMVQLYSDPLIFDRPIIMITSAENEVLDRFERSLAENASRRVRPFAKVSRENNCYKPFLEMSPADIQEVAAAVSKFYPTQNMADWNSNVFQSMCEIMDRHGYMTSLQNLEKVFSVEKGLIEDVFRSEGRILAVQSVNNEKYTAIYAALHNLQEKFQKITGGMEDGSFSMLSQVKQRRAEKKRMPFFGFVLEDGFQREFLEYLAVEIKRMTDECRPIIIIDSVKLNQAPAGSTTAFYEYISRAGDTAVNLSGESCCALLPDNDRDNFIGGKGFYMCLTTGGAAAEALTKAEVGTYKHVDVTHNRNKRREAFHLISEDSSEGRGEALNSERARISGQDIISLGKSEAFFTHRQDAVQVKHLIFDEIFEWT